MASTICRVRFDTECVLIPEAISPSRMPRLLKKSYSLPLWRKKPPPVSVPSSSIITTDDLSTSPNDDGRTRFGFSRSVLF